MRTAFEAYSTETLITYANSVSIEIDEVAFDQGNLPGEYHVLLADLFRVLTSILELRGEVVSDLVMEPQFIACGRLGVN